MARLLLLLPLVHPALGPLICEGQASTSENISSLLHSSGCTRVSHIKTSFCAASSRPMYLKPQEGGSLTPAPHLAPLTGQSRGCPLAGTVAPWRWSSLPRRTGCTRRWASRPVPSSSTASSSRGGTRGSPGGTACGSPGPPAPALLGSPSLQGKNSTSRPVYCPVFQLCEDGTRNVVSNVLSTFKYLTTEWR